MPFSSSIHHSFRGFRAIVLAAAVASPAARATGGDVPRPITLRALYGLHAPANLQASRTALVLVDFQREFTTGRLPVTAGEDAAVRGRELLAWARAHGVRVVHVRQVAASPSSAVFAPGSPATEPIAGFEAAPGEWTIVKHQGGAFSGTGLEAQLQAAGVEQLVVAGIMTHLAVDTTARDAVARGFRVVVAADATATRDLPATDGGEPVPAAVLQRAALASLSDRYADVLPVAAIRALPVVP